MSAIGKSAFQKTQSLEELDLQKTQVKYINDNTFRDSGVKSVILPNDILSIGSHAFDNCELTKIILPDSITYISDSAFERCSDLTKINIPTNITEICNGTFYLCTKLSNWDFNKSKLQVVGNDGFHSCFELTSFNFDNLVSIGDRAFMCTGIKEICLHESITYLGAEAFERCTELTKVETKIKCIPKLTFDGCSSLKSIEFTNLIEIGGGAFANCTSLVLNNLPATVASIGDGDQHIGSIIFKLYKFNKCNLTRKY